MECDVPAVLPRTDQTLICNWLNRRENSASKKISEESKQLAAKARKVWKDLTASEKVSFFKQWQAHKEEAEPLAWTSSFHESVTDTVASSSNWKKGWFNQMQILKEYAQEHLRGKAADDMLEDILFQQAAKHKYEREVKHSPSGNPALHLHRVIIDPEFEDITNTITESSLWGKTSSLEAQNK
eukprot:3554014-Amphidinium_carterae.1